MKAIRIHQYGDASTLKLEEVPPLSISEDQILVRVRDAGVNPIDWKIRQGYLKNVMPAAFPMTVGQDFAGEVAQCGKGVNQFKAGDRVCELASLVEQGAVKPRLGQTMNLSQAKEAQELSETGRTHGKVILKVA